jgi:metallo-beta-lactamase family protein
MATVIFHGAYGCVTGSCTELAWSGRRLLVDCGLYQGDDDLEQRNWRPFPFSPPEIAAVVVTHAHLDHTGLLPRLVQQGFSGPIYCTKPSRALISLVLQDAATLQEEQARFAARAGYSRHEKPQALYRVEDARKTLRHLQTLPFDDEREIFPGISLRYRRAGHLLGAATVEISAKDAEGERKTWCFSGDVGRFGVPILRDPEPPIEPPAALLLESTYGDRRHPVEDSKELLATTIEKTFERGGSVILPAFSLGRSQELLYHLTELADEGRLPASAVFLDSPMAIEATEIYDRAEGEHDEELIRRIDAGDNPFAAGRFQRCRTVEQSKALNARSEPAVIVAGSGMANGGRVVHHLLHRLGDPRNTVIFAGFQAAGTRGRALVDGATTVGIQGRSVPVRAEIVQLHGLSAHADQAELLRWVAALPGPPARIFLNHGEDAPRKALAAALLAAGSARPQTPLAEERVPW